MKVNSRLMWNNLQYSPLFLIYRKFNILIFRYYSALAYYMVWFKSISEIEENINM